MSKLNASPLGLTLDSLTGDPGPDYGPGKQIPSKFNHPGNNTIVFTPWPSGALDSNNEPANRRKLHSDDIYDSRLSNIIKVLDDTYVVEGKGETKGTYYPLKLKAMDFAYLKNVGVYPNNRLMIARRYGGPVHSDPTVIAQNPTATLISWIPEGQDFISFEVGEEWTEADADFTGIFNELGKDISGVLSKMGSAAGEGFGAIPLPGFTEIFQRRIMAKLGIASPESGDIIPSGSPNLIKEAKRRKTVGYGEKGSGLKASISIKMVCDWEQKFIAGVDPTIAWMDILNMVMKFSTSPSIFYLGETKAAGNFKKFVEKIANNPNTALDDIIKAISESVEGIVQDITKALNDEEDGNDKEINPSDVISKFKQLVSTGLSGLAQKYKVRLIGVTDALTGSPSAPWHVTIGNPLRPVFASGDMLVESVTVTLGPELAFNDLPSSIKAEFTLKNARNLGLQEIMTRFNNGYLRTLKVKTDLYESKTDAEFIAPDNQLTPRSGTQSPPVTTIGNQQYQNANFAGQNNVSSSSAFENPGTGVSGTGNSGETRVGNSLANTGTINPDANSTDVVSSELNSSFSQKSTDAEDRMLGITPR